MNRVRGARWPQRSVNSAQKAYATLATHRSITVIYGWSWAGVLKRGRLVAAKYFAKFFTACHIFQYSCRELGAWWMRCAPAILHFIWPGLAT